MAARRGSPPPLGWRVVLSIISIMGFYVVGSLVALHFFGEQTVATLDGAHMVSEDPRGDKDLMYRITISYHFHKDGKEYHNSVVYRSGETLSRVVGDKGPRTVRIRYLEAFPYINNLETRVNLGARDLVFSFAAMGLLAWFFCLINGIGQARPNGRQELQSTSGERITMSQIMNHRGGDYDESVQEYYEEGWHKDDPSWRCRCGHWSAGLFCPSCGRRREP